MLFYTIKNFFSSRRKPVITKSKSSTIPKALQEPVSDYTDNLLQYMDDSDPLYRKACYSLSLEMDNFEIFTKKLFKDLVVATLHVDSHLTLEVAKDRASFIKGLSKKIKLAAEAYKRSVGINS